MQRHPPSSVIPERARGASIALGNFDGVHKGHQSVIEIARAHGQTLGVAVFEPHPRRFFQPGAAPFRLQSSAQRARALAAQGVAHVFEIGFDQKLAQSSDADFAAYVLRDRLGVSHVSVGADFRFGRGRMGDAARLEELGRALGFGVTAAPAVESSAGKISSTSIRTSIGAGDMGAAAILLGRPWAIEGEVVRGFGRGRGFGFATANVALGDYVRPRLGIYAVRVRIGGVLHDGVASIGVNPTLGALPEPLLEAHVFGFDADLYGETIEVEMTAFLRDEAHFADIAALKAQMARDAHAAKAALTP